MKPTPRVIAAALLVCAAAVTEASGVIWVDRPDARDTYLPRRKDLVLEEADGLTIQLRTNRHPENSFAVGEKVRAIVAVSEDSFVYLIGIDEKWDVAQIFPGRQFTDNRVKKGAEQAIPPERGARIGYYAPDCAGRQYLIAVASPTAVDLAPHLGRLRERRGEFDGALAGFRQSLDSAAPGCAVASCSMTIKEAAKVVAVVVGCGAYGSQALGSTVPDAKAFGKYLEDTFKSRLKMRLLCDRGRAEITEALSSWLPSQVTAGDTIFVYFSGHGTSAKDVDGDEPDGMDEALVPTDFAPAPTGDWPTVRNRLILDDDLHTWVKSASDKGAAKTILVFDACHSGTAQRGLSTAGAPVGGPYVPKVFRGLFTSGDPAPVPQVVGRGIGDQATGADAGGDANWGVIAACKDSEISWAGDPLSLMTTHLLEGLTKQNGRLPCDTNRDGKASIEEAARYARERVRSFVSENRERLGKSTAGGDPTQTVTTLDSGNALIINE